MTVTRRQFLKLTGVAGVGAVLAACRQGRGLEGGSYQIEVSEATPFPQDEYAPQLQWVQNNIDPSRQTKLYDRNQVFFLLEPENNFPHLTLQTSDKEGGLGQVLSLNTGRFEFSPKDNLGGFKYLFLPEELKTAYSPSEEKILLAEEGLVHTWKTNGQSFAELLTREEINTGLNRNNGVWNEGLYENIQMIKMERALEIKNEIRYKQQNLLLDPATAIILTIAGRTGREFFAPNVLEEMAMRNPQEARELAEIIIVNAASSRNLSREAMLRKAGFTNLCVSTCADSRVGMGLPTTILIEDPPSFYLGKRVVDTIPGMADALQEMRTAKQTQLAVEIQTALGSGLGNFDPTDEAVRNILIFTHEGTPCSVTGCGALGALAQGEEYLRRHGVSDDLIDFLKQAHLTPRVEDDTKILSQLAAQLYNKTRADNWASIHPERFDWTGSLLPEWQITVTGAVYPHQGGDPARILGNYTYSGLPGLRAPVKDLGIEAIPRETDDFIYQSFLLQQRLGAGGSGQNPAITLLDFTHNGSTQLGGPLEPDRVMRLTPPQNGPEGVRQLLIEAEYPTQHFTNNRIIILAVESEEMAQNTAQAILEGGIPKWSEWLANHGSDGKLIITIAGEGQPYRRVLVLTADAIQNAHNAVGAAVTNIVNYPGMIINSELYELALAVLRDTPESYLALLRPDLVTEIRQGHIPALFSEGDILPTLDKLEEAVRAGTLIPQEAGRLKKILTNPALKTVIRGGARFVEVVGWVGDIFTIIQLAQYAKTEMAGVNNKVRFGHTAWSHGMSSYPQYARYTVYLASTHGQQAAEAFDRARLSFNETTANSFKGPELDGVKAQLAKVIGDIDRVQPQSDDGRIERREKLGSPVFFMTMFNTEDGGIARYVPLYEGESRDARDLPVGALIPIYKAGFEPGDVPFLPSDTQNWNLIIEENLEGFMLRTADGQIAVISYDRNMKTWKMGELRFSTLRQNNHNPENLRPVSLAMRLELNSDGKQVFILENVTGVDAGSTIDEKRHQLEDAYPEVIWPWMAQSN